MEADLNCLHLIFISELRFSTMIIVLLIRSGKTIKRFPFRKNATHYLHRYYLHSKHQEPLLFYNKWSHNQLTVKFSVKI